jgi:ABC-type glycerol-3-phosphate transport system substrate-binding protein
LPSIMRINRLLLAISIGIAMLVLPACHRRQQEPGVVHLRAWTMWGGDEAEAFQVVVDEFNRTHPHIQVHNLAAVEDTKIIRAIVANDPPEIFTLRDPGLSGLTGWQWRAAVPGRLFQTVRAEGVGLCARAHCRNAATTANCMQ